MNILVVCSDFPYPADHGGRVDTWGRVKALAELGWTVDLLVCGKHRPTDADRRAVKEHVRDIALCERRSGPLDLLRAAPLQVCSRDGLRRVKLEDDYDYVLLEGDYVCPILDNPDIRAERAILRVHNDEASYFRSLARSTGHWLHKLYYGIESVKFARLQKKLLRRVSNYLFISSKEHGRFAARNPSAASLFLPPPVTREPFRSGSFEEKRIVFIGSLFMPNNREAIRWYLDYIHPHLLAEPDYRFVVAGNSRGKGVAWLHERPLERVEVHDTPESLEEIYARGYLFVNPMRNGAGVKLKTIEAIQNGLPVVSTSVGCEGTGLADGEHIRIADEPGAFLHAVRELLSAPRAAAALLERSQQFIRTRYNHKEMLRSYFELLAERSLKEGGAVHAGRPNQRYVRDARG